MSRLSCNKYFVCPSHYHETGTYIAKTPEKEKAPKQEFLVKLRSKGDLLKALKADGVLFL